MHASDSRSLVEAVRAAADITRLVGEYVHLKPAGARLRGLCPFHQEKTPSFSVDPKNQLFYCFGCQTGGDVFKFVELHEKVDFREALEILARRFGVPLPTRTRASETQDRLHLLNDAAAEFFRARLADPTSGRRARDYIARRGLGAETVARLGLGYAPGGWEDLRTHLLSRRFQPDELVQGGLAVARSGGSGAYDRFRDRLMFPIRDVQGRTIAFGGRCLDGSEPKYINSPETAAYVKGSHLYGLDRARDAIRAAQRAVVVEGYLDLAAAVQAGVGHVVATLGTAFTPEQARLLKRYTDRVVVSYDGDTAGQNATARSLDLLLEAGFDVRVAELPPGSDPDDCIRDEGEAAYRRRLDEAPVYFEFLVRREARSRDLSQVGEKVAAVNALLPRLARMPSAVERASWAGQIADALRIDDELVLQELHAALRGRRERIRQRAAADGPLRPAEALLVTRLLQDETGEAPALVDPGDVAGTRIAAIVGAILDLRRATGAADFPRVFAALDSEEDRRLLARIAVTDTGSLETEGLGECVRVLRLDRLVRERGELQRQIERAADPSALDALLVKKQEIGRLIDGL